tara:strand:- start:636 stop:1427 length:792 start_codon:yes stop_codon:yes gene_type:complete
MKYSHFCLKIQNKWRKYLIYLFNKTQGPAMFNRSLCNNTEDFLTTEKMNEIPYEFFISYKDSNDFIYGFNLLSISTLLDKKNYNNPYTRNEINKEFMNNVYKRKKYNNIFKFNNEHIIRDNSPNIEDINTKFVSIFQTIDSLGNYSHVEWITQLNNRSLRKFISEIYDIWFYRSELTFRQRSELCPPHGTPFRNIPIHLFQNRHIYIENYTLKQYIYQICNNLINNNITNDNKSVCAIYILTSLTLVNPIVAEALPWLYQSVI